MSSNVQQEVVKAEQPSYEKGGSPTGNGHGKGLDPRGKEEANHGTFADGFDDDFNRGRVDAGGVSAGYERKVFLMNKIMQEEIGFGAWHWGLMLVAGLGWLIDNIWLQGVAIILPQVGKEFADAVHTPWMTFALYIGLISGAAFWGIMADVVGRRFSFNATLFIGGVFGIAAGGAPSFTALGGMLAALGFGIGGSLPVDGMLFLEFIPGSHQYLLTFLSVFWAFGQLLASLVAWPLIANFSCTGSNSAPAEAGLCDVALNMGWRYTFYTLGGFTMVSWIARFFIFRLPESPKYLLFHGRDAEAIEVLRDIAGRCHKTIPEDVLSLSILRSVAGEDTTVTEEDTIVKKRKGLGGMVDDAKALPGNLSKALGGKTKHEGGFLAHFKPLFATKKLAWQSSNLIFIWGLIGLAYPLYNAFLPSYLAERNGVGGSSGTDATYRDYAIISTCGIPGSILAAWFVELPRSGRKGALAVSTLITGVFVFALTGAPNNAAYLALNCIAACFQNMMYGVLYGYTPESFPAPVRGTGDGLCSSFNRVTGLMAPIIRIYATGSVAAPLFCAGAIFCVAAIMSLLLTVETQGRSAM